MARNKFNVDERLETSFNVKYFRRVLKYVKPYTKTLIFAFTASAMNILLLLLIPIFTRIVIDQMIPKKNIGGVVLYAVLSLLCAVVATYLIQYRHRKTAIVGQEVITQIRHDLFAHLQELPFTYFDDRPHGKILIRVVNYVNNVADMLSNGIITFFLDLFNLVFIAIFMFFTSVQLSLIVLAGLPILAIVIFSLKPKIRKSWQDFSNKSSNLNAYTQESVDGMKITAQFVRQETNFDIFSDLSTKLKNQHFKVVKLANLVWLTVESISAFITMTIYYGSVQWFGTIISFGTILAVVAYAGRFWQPILSISTLYNNFLNMISYLERIFETMDEPVDIKDAPGAIELPPITGKVEFKNVTFSYEEGNNILENLSFTVEPGESVALVGPTGAGKTTIVNLISRFYDISSGEILLDGHNIQDVTLRSLRSQMGIMLQDSFIFAGTIEENLRYGNLNATSEDMEKTINGIGLGEFISGLKDGLKTTVGERGSGLSVGECQLVSLLRTLLADPKILILDEATSSIDAKCERMLQQGLKEVLKGRTSFIIAHRLSTIKECDKIMYVSEKGITECGTHIELMKKKGSYYNLHQVHV